MELNFDTSTAGIETKRQSCSSGTQHQEDTLSTTVKESIVKCRQKVSSFSAVRQEPVLEFPTIVLSSCSCFSGFFTGVFSMFFLDVNLFCLAPYATSECNSFPGAYSIWNAMRYD